MREKEYEDEELEEEFEIYTGERKSVKAVNAPEEQLPDEYQKRKKFLTDLSRLEPPNAFYPPFLQALKDLNQEIRVLTTPNKDGWPILDRERKATLMRLYMETAERLQEFLKQKRSKSKDDEIITNEINTNRIITNEIKEDEIITNRISTHEIKEDEINIDQDIPYFTYTNTTDNGTVLSTYSVETESISSAIYPLISSVNLMPKNHF